MGRRGRLSPSLLRVPVCGLSRRSRGPPRRGSGARAQQPCAVHAHDHPRASPATIAVAVDGYRTCWIVTGGTPRRCSAPRLDPRQSMVAFRGSGSRVVSRITIERFRLSSDPGGSSRPACTSAPAGSLAAILYARRAGACSVSARSGAGPAGCRMRVLTPKRSLPESRANGDLAFRDLRGDALRGVRHMWLSLLAPPFGRRSQFALSLDPGRYRAAIRASR